MKQRLNKYAQLLGVTAIVSGTILLSSFTHAGNLKREKKTVNISGTRFFFPLIEKWADEFEKENPDIDIVVQFGIPNKDIEATGTPVTKENPEKGRYTVVSRFSLVPIVNEKNPAWSQLQKKGLSKADFEKIYFKGDQQQSSF